MNPGVRQTIERILDRVSKASTDGYPPYNVEQTGPDSLRITLAVAGFSKDELSVSVEDDELSIAGKQVDDADRVYIHRGIAARQFQRRFVLAQGIEVQGATLDNGLLHIDLVRPEIEAHSRTIEIQGAGARSEAEDGGQEISVEPHRKRT